MAKYILITGASSGIGYEVAKAFAARGDNIIITARRATNLEQLKAEINTQYPDVEVVVRICDLSKAGEAKALYESLRGCELKAIINNAGRGNRGGAIEDDLTRDLNMLHLNMDAVYILTSLYARDYKDVEGAQVINVSSIGGYLVVPGSSLYCATKFFVSSFSEGIDLEMKKAGHKLRVKVIAPTTTETEYEQTAHDSPEPFDYASRGSHYFTAAEIAAMLLKLYDSDATVGSIDFVTRKFRLDEPQHPHL